MLSMLETLQLNSKPKPPQTAYGERSTLSMLETLQLNAKSRPPQTTCGVIDPTKTFVPTERKPNIKSEPLPAEQTQHTIPLGIAPIFIPPTATLPKEEKKKPKLCSQCRVPGHDARNCPLNRFGLVKKDADGYMNGGMMEQRDSFTETTTTKTTTKTTTTTTTKREKEKVMGGRVEKKTKGMGK